MGKGTVTHVHAQGAGETEYMIGVDFGDGLSCIYGEINEALVVAGQKVKHLDPIGKANMMGGLDNVGEIELYCMDANIKEGLRSSNGRGDTAVSPFDYLNTDDKALLEKMYTERVIDKFLKTGETGSHWTPVEPYLTNRIIVHEPDKIEGEWFLIGKDWDGNSMTLLTFVLSKNDIYKGNHYALSAEDKSHNVRNSNVGTYQVTYSEGGKGKLILKDKRWDYLQYALFEITEDAGLDSEGTKRARMKFEISEKPIKTFSDKALTYQSRGVWNPRYDAGKLGGWLDYQ